MCWAALANAIGQQLCGRFRDGPKNSPLIGVHSLSGHVASLQEAAQSLVQPCFAQGVRDGLQLHRLKLLLCVILHDLQHKHDQVTE